MKFKFYLNSIEGIDIVPIISLVFFFVFFLGVAYYVYTLNKETVFEISNLPLNDSDVNNSMSN